MKGKLAIIEQHERCPDQRAGLEQAALLELHQGEAQADDFGRSRFSFKEVFGWLDLGDEVVALPCLERLVLWVRRLIAPLGVVASGRQGHQLWFVNAPKNDVASNQ